MVIKTYPVHNFCKPEAVNIEDASSINQNENYNDNHMDGVHSKLDELKSLSS